MKTVRWLFFVASLASVMSTRGSAVEPHSVNGLVLSVDAAHRKLVVSCQEVAGFMDAKVLPVIVRDPKLLDGVTRGSLIEFRLVPTKEADYAEEVRIRTYDSAEREPSNARRLRTLDKALGGQGVDPVLPGSPVPDFALIDQKNRPVRLRQFIGKLVVLNFVYTRCILPDYCYRLSNNFRVVQKLQKGRLGRDLILLSVTFDPVHDRPEVLLDYAKTWNADPENWRFLTGSEPDVQRVCALFGVNSFADEGLFVHTMHTALIDRDGKLIANLEGNQFTAQQLADLVEASLSPQNP